MAGDRIEVRTAKGPGRAAAAALFACVLAAALLLLTQPAFAAETSEADQGRALTEQLQSGEKECGDLTESDFELIGEYAMETYFGSSSAHEAMNERMKRMMGADAERTMHAALGHRYTGCPGGPWSSAGDGAGGPHDWGFMGMMGGPPAPGMMGAPPGSSDEGDGSTGYGPMMGAGGDGGWTGYGPMMDREDGDDDEDEGVSTLGAIGLFLGGMLLGALLVVGGVTLGRRRRP